MKNRKPLPPTRSIKIPERIHYELRLLAANRREKIQDTVTLVLENGLKLKRFKVEIAA